MLLKYESTVSDDVVNQEGRNTAFPKVFVYVFWQCMQPQFRSCDETPSWLLPQKTPGTFSEVCVECRNAHRRVQESQPRYPKTQLGRSFNDFVHYLCVCVCVCMCVCVCGISFESLHNSCTTVRVASASEGGGNIMWYQTNQFCLP